MDFQTIKYEVLQFLKSQDTIFEQKYVRYAVILLGGSLLAIFMGYGLYVYRLSQKHKAFDGLSACLVYFDQMVEKKEGHDWKAVTTFCEQKKREYETPATAGYFDLIIADALMRDGSLERALEHLRAIDNHVNKAFYDLAKLKYALMLIDHEKETYKNEGFKLLDELVLRADQTVKDAVVYHAGRCYFAHGNQAKARQLFESLVHENSYFESVSPSYWAAMARVKLDHL